MKNYIKIAEIFKEMEVLSLQKKDLMVQNGELISTIDESVETNDKQAIVDSYNAPERMFPELAQNAKDSHSKNVAFINKSDIVEVKTNNALHVYNIVANNGDQMSEDVMVNTYAQLPGRSTKKNNPEMCGSFGYGSCYKFFQPTLTFAYDATNNCCYVAYTSPKNLLDLGNVDYMPIVTTKIDGSFCEIVGMSEEEFGFKPTFINVFQDNIYLNPNGILLNENLKKHIMASPLCSMDTLDLENEQTYVKVKVDLLSVPNIQHEAYFNDTHNKMPMTFTCFARPFSETSVEKHLKEHDICLDFNYVNMPNTHALKTLIDVLAKTEFAGAYRFYREDANRYYIIFVGYEDTMYMESTIYSLSTSSHTFKTSTHKREGNGLFRAYKGHPCVNDMPKHNDLWERSVGHVFQLQNGYRDHTRIVVNDNTLKQDLNRANFCRVTPEQEDFLNNVAEKFASDLRRDFRNIIKRYDKSENALNIAVLNANKTIGKNVAKLCLTNSTFFDYSNPEDICKNMYNYFSDQAEPKVRENFKTLMVDTNLTFLEKFAQPIKCFTSKKVDSDCLAVDMFKVSAEYSDLKQIIDIQKDPKTRHQWMLYIAKNYSAVLEYESSLSHFFEHGHVSSLITHLVVTDVDGFELGVAKTIPNLDIEVCLTKNEKAFAKARYELSITSFDTGLTHKIDVLNLQERFELGI